MRHPHESYMRRCFDLARLGAGQASPNPMVGAVLVYQGRIIGEGWHQRYGQAHAEVNAVASVRSKDRDKIPQSTLYVSLEPCCIQGNTPACTDLIQREKIPHVVISCLDLSPAVAGRGVEILRKAGVQVTAGILEEAGKRLAAIRNVFVSEDRPYVVLKWAASADGYIGETEKQIWLTNRASKRLVHKWRSELDAVMVGTQTAITDNPRLNNRLYYGRDPKRVVLDRNHRLNAGLHLLDDSQPTLVFSEKAYIDTGKNKHTERIELPQRGLQDTSALLSILAQRNISSLLVEGGSRLLESFIRDGMWDEARIFLTPHWLGKGVAAPAISGRVVQRSRIGEDILIRMMP